MEIPPQMPVIERLLRSIPYVRRPFYQRDLARAKLEAIEIELAAARAELAALKTVRLNGRAWEETLRQLHNELCFITADDDARQDQLIGDFRAYIARQVGMDDGALEIGPSYSPILAKSAGYNVTVLDHADQAGLVEKYTPHGVDVARIEPVDIVWKGNSLTEAVGAVMFDAIVASHALEHVPDLIQFLADCSGMLRPHGSIYLLVPDKRYSFDFFQPLSDVAKLLGDHRAKRTRHSFESFYRLAAAVRNGERIAWDQTGITELAFADDDPRQVRTLAERYAAANHYVDTHANYFTPASFAMILDELRYLDEIDLELELLTRPRGCEFLAVLRKAAVARMTAEHHAQRKMQGYARLMAEQLEWIRSTQAA